MAVMESGPSRAEHLEWCKGRARVYLDVGDWQQSWTSFASDMGKHDETREHPALMLGMMLLMSGSNASVPEMRKFIEGFN